MDGPSLFISLIMLIKKCLKRCLSNVNFHFLKQFFNFFLILAVNHGTEYPYLQGVHMFRDFNFNDEDKKVREFMISSFVSFIKTGLVIFFLEVYVKSKCIYDRLLCCILSFFFKKFKINELICK